MLRYGFMASDFHPLMLMLGEASDLRRLADALRGFAAAPREVRFGADLPCSPSDTVLSIVPTDSDYGMRRGEDGGFRWGLNAWQAGQIADRLDKLADPGHRSGSDIFELGIEGEFPVKVSRGEFTDDFLVRSGFGEDGSHEARAPLGRAGLGGPAE